MACQTAIHNPYSIKSVKTFQGMEGKGFECSLFKEGKKIGTVTDVADGGEIRFYISEEEIDFLENYALNVAAFEGDDKEFFDKEMVIYRLVDQFDEKRTLKRWCKTKTVFRIEGDAEGKYRTHNNKFNTEIKEYLEQKYKGENLYIINEHLT